MKSLELLENFKGSRSDESVAEALGVNRTTVVMARKAGRLSPALSAKIAEILGENRDFWVSLAVAEQQTEPARSALFAVLENWRARRDSNPRPLPSEWYAFRQTVVFFGLLAIYFKFCLVFSEFKSKNLGASPAGRA